MSVWKMRWNFAVGMLAFLQVGCSPEDVVRGELGILIWLATPLAVAAILTFLVRSWRKSQLEEWDLYEHPSEPDEAPIARRVIWTLSILCAILTSIFFLIDGIDPWQIAISLVLMAASAAIGGALALRLGLSMANSMLAP